MKRHSSEPFSGRSCGGSAQQAAIRFTTTNDASSAVAVIVDIAHRRLRMTDLSVIHLALAGL
jgi:hypothetical protein